jgi:DNA-binding XRE family transcriptional regulator
MRMLGVVTSKDTYWGDASAGFTAAPAHRKRPVLPYSENDFLAQLGERVRTVRLSRDMSRRQLADRSGISERYIAQIEAGKCNVSIMLLLRIAHAVRD